MSGFNASSYARSWLALAVVFAGATESRAIDKFWGSNTGGLFSDPNKWQNGVAGSGDVARFGLTISDLVIEVYTVNFFGDTTNQALKIEDDRVTFELSGHKYTASLASGTQIGTVANRLGQLTITNGSMLFAAGSSLPIGAVANASGKLIVTTAGQISGVANFRIGDQGPGALAVNGGGTISSAFSSLGNLATVTGDATVDGPGSKWANSGDMNVGASGPGTLKITQGGEVQSGLTNIGLLSNLSCSMSVEGAGSKFTGSNQLVIGSNGPGTLDIKAGGVVTSVGSSRLSNGSTGNGTASVDGVGSKWTNAGELSIGFAGTGKLNITAGGQVSNSAGLVGRFQNSMGTITVDGVDSQWINSGDLYVGDLGEGSLEITGGASVSSVRFLAGRQDGSEGAVVVDGAGSKLIATDRFAIGGGESSAPSGGGTGKGSLLIRNGGSVSSSVSSVTGSSVGGSFKTHGEAIVTGAGSGWTTGNLGIGGTTSTGTLTIIDGGGVSAKGMTIPGQVLVSGVGSALSASSFVTIYGAVAADSTLTIEAGGTFSSGTLITDNVHIGVVQTMTQNTATVTGAGSKWTHSGRFFVGNSINTVGNLNIENGGKVSGALGSIAAGQSTKGTVKVNGADSAWNISGELVVGERGTALLEVKAGGSVSNTLGTIGKGSDSNGTAEVSDPGSVWTNGDLLRIGVAGPGTLNIKNGGNVLATSGALGSGATGNATVTGAGSTWTNSTDLFVGELGFGALNIEKGGKAINETGVIGKEVFGNGSTTVTDPGSVWTNNAALVVGDAGTGALTIQNGGKVSNQACIIGKQTGSHGTVTLNGGGALWAVAGRLAIGGDADTETQGGSGEFNIQSGGLASTAQDIVLFPGGVLKLEGGELTTVGISFHNGGQFQWTSGTLHAGAYNGNLINVGGILSPGSSPGSTTIFGNYTQQAGARLDIEVGGTLPGITHDLVSVTAKAFPGGELRLTLLNGFLPTANDKFTVLNAPGGISGAFANVANGQRLVTADGLGSFQVNYGAGSAFNANQIVLSDFVPNAVNLTLLSAASRRLHGTSGSIDLDLDAPLAGLLREPRLAGASPRMVLTFSGPPGALTCGSFTIAGGTCTGVVVSGNSAIISLNPASLAKNSCLKVTATGVQNLTGDHDVTAVLHEGNVNGDASVNLADLQAVKNVLLVPVTAANVTRDVTCDGSINLSDLQAVKNNLLVPAACP